LSYLERTPLHANLLKNQPNKSCMYYYHLIVVLLFLISLQTSWAPYNLVCSRNILCIVLTILSFCILFYGSGCDLCWLIFYLDSSASPLFKYFFWRHHTSHQMLYSLSNISYYFKIIILLYSCLSQILSLLFSFSFDLRPSFSYSLIVWLFLINYLRFPWECLYFPFIH
jgi:hypothetical protein